MHVQKLVATLAFVGGALAFSLPAMAHEAEPAKAATQADAEDDAEPVIDAEAIAALNKMGAALRALNEFTIDAVTTKEVVLDSGEKIQMDGRADWKIKKPNELYVRVTSDRSDREFFYDGKDLAIFSPRLEYYTTIDGVNASLTDFILRASNEYGVELPLMDLFFWGTKYAPTDLIKAAMEVGPGTIDGEKIDQYAFRQDGVDWQVWISQATSLPRKLVITSLDDDARPQYSARLTWNATATLPDSTFNFVAPKSAQKIKFTPDAEAAAGGEEEGS